MQSDAGFDVVVIGGGAAGFFGVLEIARRSPSKRILLLERSNKLLSKVRVSGGGRCNVTHACFDAAPLSRHYPRGQRELKKIFHQFQARHVVDWFQEKGVTLKTEADGRIFPATDSSETIIQCFLDSAKAAGIKVETGRGVERISKAPAGFTIHDTQGREVTARKVLIATGGHPQAQSYQWIRDLGHAIVAPIPSLFTFNDSGGGFKDLMGVAVAKAEVRIASTRLTAFGPVLITHWGLSGPAVIRLSAWAAEHLKLVNYSFIALVNWTGLLSEDVVRDTLGKLREDNPKKGIQSNPLAGIPQRLWERLTTLSGIQPAKVWGEASNKDINRLIEHMTRCPFQIKGKTTFKEEFVTCGGVDLGEVNLDTMESKIMPGIYFAGEVLNVDGETGGFNFQSAWSTAFVAASAM